jgi:hypothetical protein
MAGPGNILIKIGAEAGQAVAELGTINRALGDTQTTSQKMGTAVKKAALPATIALAALAAGALDAAKAAAEDAAASDKLQGVLERTTGATKDQAKATDDWVEKLTLATGVSDDKLRPALGKLASATGDVGLAQKDLKLALDVAAASGKDVVTVSAAIAKGYTGQTAGLNKLVPGLDQATLKSKDMVAITAELADKTGGAMARQAATASGQFAIFTNQMTELKESLGAGLLPVLQSVLPVLNQFGAFASAHTTTIKLLVAAVAALAAGIVVANVAMKAYAAGQAIATAATKVWTAAQWLLNAALEANPIGLITVAIAALAAGLVIAYTRSATFRAIVQGALSAVEDAARALAAAFRAVLDAASSAFDWIVSHWRLAAIVGLGPIGAAIVVLADHFNSLKAIAVGAFDAIESAIGSLAGAIESIIGAVERLLDAIGRIHVPHINLPGPFLAPASSDSPLGRSSSGPGAFAATAGGVTVNVYGAIDPEGTARAIRRVLGDSSRRRGAR